MLPPLLTSKYTLPPLRPSMVRRSLLIARLNAGLHRKLTLVSAPAGAGKTTLVRAWLAACARPAAWLSLEEADSEPTRFLRYLIAAVRGIAPEFGQDVYAMLDAPQPPPIDALLPLLINGLALLPPALLVLDDFHVLDSPTLHHALTTCIEHLPAHVHLVLTTRTDPPFPLARLRVRDQLNELRAIDLRFTAAETAAFLTQVMELDLAPEHLSALEDRTEGWVAGLQLAALSLRGRRDVGQFVRAFSGNHRSIVDYLLDEVLQRQPPHVRAFLLQTAILNRLCGPLCDAVTERQDSQQQLEALERGNFFLIALDDTRHWYRYHHLFAGALAAQLHAEQPDLLPTLHLRASIWHDQRGDAIDAIRYALAGGVLERAADLIELELPALRRSRQESLLVSWLKLLPDAVLRDRPVLCVGAVGALLGIGELSGVEERLRWAEDWLNAASTDTSPIVRDEAAFRLLPGAIALYRAGYALARADLAGTVVQARRAIASIPAGESLMQGAASGLLGMASWAGGDLVAAQQSFADSMANLQRAGHLADVLGCAIGLADVQTIRGQLGAAWRTYEDGVRLAAGAPLRGLADMYTGLADIACERYDLPAAERYLSLAQETGQHLGLPQYAYRWRVAMAQVKESRGDLDGALTLLQAAEQCYDGDFFPNVRPLPARRALVHLAHGRLHDALGWAQGLSPDDDIPYLREFAYSVLARVLLARPTTQSDGMRLAQRLLHAAETGGRIGTVIELLVLLALAHDARGDVPAALGALDRALLLAAPEGHARVFIREGRPMVRLLERALAQNVAPVYARHLLTLASGHTVPPAARALIEPLSERERAVLRLLTTDLSGPDIARELVVSLNTLRTHTRHIYDKLGVSGRRAAVRRAEELGLL